MTQFSVNINKIAKLRYSRGGYVPDLLKVAAVLQSYGAQGITIHPRPDQRHIRYDDALALPAVLTTEFNIEGNPIPKFIDLVIQIQPDQVTLVPDSEDAITSNAGWDTIKNIKIFWLRSSVSLKPRYQNLIFVDPIEKMVEGAKNTEPNRIELYTEAYAQNFKKNPEKQ